MNTKDLKEKILNDDLFASKIEYLLSKSILENPIIHKTVFVHKKQKIILGKNRLYSIYDLNTGEKKYSGIHFQEVAKYVARNIKNQYLSEEIIRIENELFRYKDKIEFMKNSIYQRPSETKLAKLSADIYQYIKHRLIKELSRF